MGSQSRTPKHSREEIERMPYKELRKIAKGLKITANLKQVILIKLILLHYAGNIAEVERIHKDVLTERRNKRLLNQKGSVDVRQHTVRQTKRLLEQPCATNELSKQKRRNNNVKQKQPISLNIRLHSNLQVVPNRIWSADQNNNQNSSIPQQRASAGLSHFDRDCPDNVCTDIDEEKPLFPLDYTVKTKVKSCQTLPVIVIRKHEVLIQKKEWTPDWGWTRIIQLPWTKVKRNNNNNRMQQGFQRNYALPSYTPVHYLSGTRQIYNPRPVGYFSRNILNFDRKNQNNMAPFEFGNPAICPPPITVNMANQLTQIQFARQSNIVTQNYMSQSDRQNMAVERPVQIHYPEGNMVENSSIDNLIDSMPLSTDIQNQFSGSRLPTMSEAFGGNYVRSYGDCPLEGTSQESLNAPPNAEANDHTYAHYNIHTEDYNENFDGQEVTSTQVRTEEGNLFCLEDNPESNEDSPRVFPGTDVTSHESSNVDKTYQQMN